MRIFKTWIPPVLCIYESGLSWGSSMPKTSFENGSESSVVGKFDGTVTGKDASAAERELPQQGEIQQGKLLKASTGDTEGDRDVSGVVGFQNNSVHEKNERNEREVDSVGAEAFRREALRLQGLLAHARKGIDILKEVRRDDTLSVENAAVFAEKAQGLLASVTQLGVTSERARVLAERYGFEEKLFAPLVVEFAQLKLDTERLLQEFSERRHAVELEISALRKQFREILQPEVDKMRGLVAAARTNTALVEAQIKMRAYSREDLPSLAERIRIVLDSVVQLGGNTEQYRAGAAQFGLENEVNQLTLLVDDFAQIGADAERVGNELAELIGGGAPPAFVV